MEQKKLSVTEALKELDFAIAAGNKKKIVVIQQKLLETVTARARKRKDAKEGKMQRNDLGFADHRQ